MKTYIVAILSFSILLFLGKSACAEDSLRVFQAKDLVVTASRSPMTAESAARSISIISSEEIKAAPVHNLQDMLLYVEGVHLQRRGPLGTQADVSVRGGTFEQTLILIDGNKVSDPQTGHHNLNLPVSLDDVERIEVLRGAASRLFGPNAFGGVINIITRKASLPELRTELAGGQHGYLSGAASLALPLENYLQQLSLTRQVSDGYRHNTDFEQTSVSYKSSLSLSQNALNFFGGYVDKAFGANQYYSEFYPDQWEQTQTGYLSLDGQFLLSEQAQTVMTPKIYWRHNEDEFLLERFDPSYRNFHKTDVYGGELQLGFSTGLGKTNIGLEAGREVIASTNLGNHARARGGIFLEEQLALGNSLTLVPGVAMYFYSDWNPQILPAIDAAYQLTETARIYGSIGKSFRIPTYTDLYYSDPISLSNPDLQPEEAWTYETGVAWQSPVWGASLGTFYRDGKNMIDWARATDDDKWQSRNVADVGTFGIEFSSSLNVKSLFNQSPISAAKFSYAFLNSGKSMGEMQSRYVFNYLKHQVIVGFTHQWFAGIEQNWSVRYEERKAQDGYALVDTKLSWRTSAENWRMEIYLEATNLFDKTYYEVEPVPMPGRWIVIGLRPAIF
ncbi:TonB-dependent receptor [Chloroherpeton thalassium ATCC 35110]|uniref:TonB-dependent receptor n=1 Tax=Chloroherpeton thalassium (strain ATCC 35110 / GB-78) TaxID=517418 RepID=B3QXH2_CHLT3|nr:TonB-dependent receptor [Chloroherpeton thalassium]ACF13446.1 TonB-dependent receptor [Chloroherpeton thalassium ATCC 35110]